MNLITLQIAAHPTGLNWYEGPWDGWSLKEMDRAIAQARKVTLGFTLVLAIEAVFLALLDQPSRRSTVSDILVYGMASVGYLLTLALAIVVNPTDSFWELNDDHDLATLSPDWYMPALIGVAIATLTGLTIWLFARTRDVFRSDASRGDGGRIQ
ncbi:hypothetical protein [Streptosporangium roseum]|uniref:hypothetical protein n=1 Tax=Streptosporangium roseum TaxID=2001 RepID=UPI0012DD9937|nr:hypothetical protein [Streptosporangium roseum]